MARTTTAVVLLKGVNVGGNNKLPMADFVRVLEGIGLTDVRTVLQSGNAVFRLPGPRAARAAEEVEAALAGELGLGVRAVVRTHDELEAVVAADPFEAGDPSRHLIGFMADLPDPAGVEALDLLELDRDRVAVIGRQAYLDCPDGLSASPLFKFAWDRRFATVVTMRNLATVGKVLALMRA